MTLNTPSSSQANVQIKCCLQLAIALLNISIEPTFKLHPWSQCLSAKVNIPSLFGDSWMLENKELEITWMTRPPTPQSLIECAECRCETGCSTMHCSSKKADLKFTNLCLCCDCQNAAARNDDDNKSSCGLAQSDNDKLEGSDLEFGNDDDIIKIAKLNIFICAVNLLEISEI